MPTVNIRTLVISVLIVVSLGFAGVILPSDRPGLLFSGSIARWLVAWGIAEVVAFTWWRLKRRKMGNNARRYWSAGGFESRCTLRSAPSRARIGSDSLSALILLFCCAC